MCDPFLPRSPHRKRLRRSRIRRPVTSYFVSLAGFRETAVEQERKRRKKIVTLTGQQVIEELVQGRILIPKSRDLTRCEGASGLEQFCAIALTDRIGTRGTFQRAGLALIPTLERRPAEHFSALCSQRRP